MNSESKKTLEDLLEERGRQYEIFRELWEAIVPRYFPEYKDDDEYADFVFNQIIGEFEEWQAYEEAKRKGMID
jgi:rubrerythrin